MYVLVLLGVTIVNECIFLYFTGKRMNNLCIFMFIYDKIKSFSFNHRFIALVYNVTLLYDYICIRNFACVVITPNQADNV